MKDARKNPSRWDPPDCYWQCTLGKPLLLYVPPGQTARIHCPTHGEHLIHGGLVTYMR